MSAICKMGTACGAEREAQGLCGKRLPLAAPVRNVCEDRTSFLVCFGSGEGWTLRQQRT
jgi:hypothetical protein